MNSKKAAANRRKAQTGIAPADYLRSAMLKPSPWPWLYAEWVCYLEDHPEVCERIRLERRMPKIAPGPFHEEPRLVHSDRSGFSVRAWRSSPVRDREVRGGRPGALPHFWTLTEYEDIRWLRPSAKRWDIARYLVQRARRLGMVEGDPDAPDLPAVRQMVNAVKRAQKYAKRLLED